MAENIQPGNDNPRSVAQRLPLGLTLAMGTLAISLGAMVVLWNLRWPTSNPLELVVHASAALCLGWGLIAQAMCRAKPPTNSAQHDMLSVLNVTQLTLGLCMTVVMLYLAMLEVFARMYQPHLQVAVWPTGMIDVSVVAVAVLLGWWRTRNGTLMTSLMWLLVLMSLWSALQNPAYVVREAYGIPHEVRVDWVSPFTLGAAFVVAAFTALSGMLADSVRKAAWPDRLEDLLKPPPRWPGFGHSAGILAAAVLVLSCIMLVSPLTPIAAMLAGASMLVLAARRWNEDFADAGLGLITVGVVSLLMIGLPSGATRADYYADVFGRTLLGLALMTGLWHWLAGVWEQQLDSGRPWTTAGRLIRPCHRVGFLLGTAGVLISMHLAFWPKLPYVYNPDNSLVRWIWGLAGDGVLILALAGAARRTGKPTLAWLCVFAMASTLAFVIIRSSGSTFYAGFMRYWPLILAGASAAFLLGAHYAARSARHKSFLEPLYLIGILIGPVAAITGGSFLASWSMPMWVLPATFAVLAGVYLIAGFLTGPRRLAVLTFVCMAAAVWTALRQT